MAVLEELDQAIVALGPEALADEIRTCSVRLFLFGGRGYKTMILS